MEISEAAAGGVSGLLNRDETGIFMGAKIYGEVWLLERLIARIYIRQLVFANLSSRRIFA